MLAVSWKSGYDAGRVSMLRIRCDPECLFRAQQTPIIGDDPMGDEMIVGYPGYFFVQGYSGRMCSGRFFAVTPRNALSWPPTNVGCHRYRHHHLACIRESL
jgi:hypothetical protein